MTQNINNENFWNELHDAYPEAVEHFWKWFEDYKKEVGWWELFNAGLQFGEAIKQPPNFNDIPFEMQNGIMARYELELFNNKSGQGKEEYKKIAAAYHSAMRKIFADLQKQIDRLSTIKK